MLNSGRKLRQAVFVAAIIDYERRARNYEEFKERVEGNIRRWEESLKKNEGFQCRTRENLRKNQERLVKAREALARRNSPSSLEWLERQRNTANTHRSEEVRMAAKEKIYDHEGKVRDIERNIVQTQEWIDRGWRDLNDAERKESELKTKISDSKRKL
jgi:chromosome segregation ATPase